MLCIESVCGRTSQRDVMAPKTVLDHRSRSSSESLRLLGRGVNVPMARRLFDSCPSQLSLWPCLREREVGESMPCSTSESSAPSLRSPADRGDTSEDDAWFRKSSSLSSRYGSYRGLEGMPLDSERTTSPLQMGQVRRRVVSHGVLVIVLAEDQLGRTVGKTYMQSTWNSCPQGKLIT